MPNPFDCNPAAVMGGFEEGNESWHLPLSIAVSDSSLIADFSSTPSIDDHYLIVVSGGENGLFDSGRRPLNGHYGSSGETSDFVSSFIVDSGWMNAPTLTEIQNVVFSPDCANSGCHSGVFPAGQLNLESGLSYASLINSVSVTSDRHFLVSPGDPNASYLLMHPDHPSGRLAQSNHKRQMIRHWIEAGALDN